MTQDFQEFQSFVLLFENSGRRRSNKRYHLPAIKLKDYNVVINGRNYFDQPTGNDMKAYENMKNINTSQRDDYTTG